MENHETEGNHQNGQAIARPTTQTGIARQGFGSSELERRGETRATDLAERAKAEVQARYIIALQRPRSWEQVFASLIKECNRPSFAETALYRIKRGKKKNEATGRWEDNWIEGLSIGFARSAMRAMGNATLDEVMTYEDDWKQIWRVTAMDLESNVTSSKDVTVPRVVERGKVNEHHEVIGQRVNSQGNTTYLVRATDDEMITKVGAMLSKARRNLILELLPADIADDAKRTIIGTRQRGDKQDPEMAKKKLIVAFGEIGIKVSQLEEYLGHPLDAIQPAELENLRGIFQAIRDGETTWATEMAQQEGAETASGESVQPAGTASTAQKVKEKLAKQRATPPQGQQAMPMSDEEKRAIEAQEAKTK